MALRESARISAPQTLRYRYRATPSRRGRRGLNGAAPISAVSGEDAPTEAASRSKVLLAASGIVTSGRQRDWLAKAPPLRHNPIASDVCYLFFRIKQRIAKKILQISTGNKMFPGSSVNFCFCVPRECNFTSPASALKDIREVFWNRHALVA